MYRTQEITVLNMDWLILDVSYLAYRNFHAMGQLAHEGVGTAVAYGIFRDVAELKDRFGVDNVAFAFDRGRPLRTALLATYKGERRKNAKENPEVAEARKEVHEQIKRMHRTLLPEAGYRNILSAEGFEADDIIAKVVIEHTDKSFIIVAADSDLYQLLDSRTSMWNPSKKKLLTETWFRNAYGLSPIQWGDVKALAGCSSDNVPGIEGVGEKTAVKYLSGALSTGKVFERIVHHHQLWQRNLQLVRLPYQGTPSFDLVPDRVTARSEGAVLDSLGIRSLRTRR